MDNDRQPSGILILGAGGFIGQALCRRLKGRADVVGYDRAERCGDGLCDVYLQRDFAHDDSLEQILRSYRIGTVYHFISPTVPTEGTQSVEDDIRGAVLPTLRLLEAMRRAGTPKLIFASSGGTVYGESRGKPHCVSDATRPICAYGIQKVAIEHYLQLYRRLYAMQTIIARISNPYGVTPQKDRTQGVVPILLRQLIEDKPITLFSNTVRDYIYIEDVISALVGLNDYRGEKSIFNIGSGIPTELEQLVGLIEACAGKTFTDIVRKELRSFDVQACVLDITETVRELQWEPRVPLRDGIRKTFLQLISM